MKKVKIFAAILAVAFVMGSSFTTTSEENFGFVSKTPVSGQSQQYDFLLVDLDEISDSDCSEQPAETCKVRLDLADAKATPIINNEFVTVRMDQVDVTNIDGQLEFVYE